MKATVWRSLKHLLHPVKLGCPETFQVESETEYSLRYGSALWILEEQDVQGSVHCSPEKQMYRNQAWTKCNLYLGSCHSPPTLSERFSLFSLGNTFTFLYQVTFLKSSLTELRFLLKCISFLCQDLIDKKLKRTACQNHQHNSLFSASFYTNIYANGNLMLKYFALKYRIFLVHIELGCYSVASPWSFQTLKGHPDGSVG